MVTTILLTVLMSMFGVKAFAHDIEVENKDGVTIYYSWINDNTELAVSRRSSYTNEDENDYSGDVVIPESVEYNWNTYPVTSIAPGAFMTCSGLNSVTIPNSVTSIGEYAFSWCTGLTSVTIPNSVTSIGKSTFYGCSSLTSVTIPNSVTSIGEKTFYECKGLTSLTIGSSVALIGEDAFFNCSGLNSIVVEDGNISYDSRNNCNAIIDKSNNTLILGCNNSIIPDGVTSIGEDAFSWCSGLTSVTIPSSVTSIGEYAFYNCSGLTSVTIPSSVTSIGEYAFYNCSGLTSVTIPSSVTSIGENTFSNCSCLTSVTIPNSVTSIGPSAFSSCSGLTSLTLSNSVTSIGNSAFSSCSGLTSLTIPNSVTLIDIGAFSYNNLTSIIVESGNTVYDSRDNCNAIIEKSSNTLITGCKNTIIPNSVTSIGEYAFSGCSDLTSVTIPSSVTSIGKSAFSGCSDLTSMRVEEGNKAYDSRNNCNAIIEKSSNTLIVGCKNTTIPNSVTSIGEYAFYDCNSLTSVTIPNSVTSIGEFAFSNCSGLTSVTIPNSVTSISNWTFTSCISLTSVTIPNSVTSIGNMTFAFCIGLTSVTIPKSVTFIGESAFFYCKALNVIGCKADTPPICYNAFAGIDKSVCKLYVPKGHKADYQAADQWNEFLLIEEGDAPIVKTDVEFTIGSSGKTTYCCDYALDFSSFEDLKAYVATGYEGSGTIWMTRVKQVPANTPILIKGDANQTYKVPVMGKCDAYFENMFKGSATEDLVISTLTDDWKYKNFYMAGGQFKPASTSQKISAGKAYLQVPATFKAANAGADQTVKIADSGKSSYAPPVDVDLTDVEGLKAYAATGYDAANSTIWLTRINKIQAGEGVLLKGEAGKEYTLPSADVQAYYGNMFVGNIGDKITIGETSEGGKWTNYYLASGSFKKVSGSREIGTNKSYLHLPTSLLVSSARGKQAGIDEWFMEELETETMLLGSIGGDDEDGTTRIDAIRQDNAQPDVYYNLQGQRVNNPKKGIYIHKGRKVVIK